MEIFVLIFDEDDDMMLLGVYTSLQEAQDAAVGIACSMVVDPTEDNDEDLQTIEAWSMMHIHKGRTGQKWPFCNEVSLGTLKLPGW